MLVEFKMIFCLGAFFVIGGIFFKLEAMGANVLVDFENVFLIGGIFFKLGAIGENVLVEFEKNFNWGHKCLFRAFMFQILSKFRLVANSFNWGHFYLLYLCIFCHILGWE